MILAERIYKGLFKSQNAAGVSVKIACSAQVKYSSVDCCLWGGRGRIFCVYCYAFYSSAVQGGLFCVFTWGKKCSNIYTRTGACKLPIAACSGGQALCLDQGQLHGRCWGRWAILSFSTTRLEESNRRPPDQDSNDGNVRNKLVRSSLEAMARPFMKKTGTSIHMRPTQARTGISSTLWIWYECYKRQTSICIHLQHSSTDRNSSRVHKVHASVGQHI